MTTRYPPFEALTAERIVAGDFTAEEVAGPWPRPGDSCPAWCDGYAHPRDWQHTASLRPLGETIPDRIDIDLQKDLAADPPVVWVGVLDERSEALYRSCGAQLPDGQIYVAELRLSPAQARAVGRALVAAADLMDGLVDRADVVGLLPSGRVRQPDPADVDQNDQAVAA